MNAFWHMTVSEWRLLFREPAAVFFTLVFPLLLLVLFGSIFGNDPARGFGGIGSVDLSTPGYIGLIIGTTAFMGIPQVVATYRDQGILRRLRATPVPALTIIGAQLVVNLAMTSFGTLILVVVGRVVFDLSLPRAPAAVLVAFLFCCLSLFAIGMLLAAILPTARVAQTVGMAIFFPMIFLSGSAFPRQMMPESIRNVAEVLPLTRVVILLSDVWFGFGWNLSAIVMLGVLLGVAAIISVRTFRWE
ncbi:MAG: ABC transporter permease [Chloroflexota bacterium]|nr:ABC transporter permease [Chloroflexota bacterium]